ncbi:alpha/beta fold hydrolase [Stackebrandtia nassauensis]|uniref:Alpha/beta hydrolase fold protein n=1 Tax=Stackebrandtia nassauensis (strain DSM 44728 / CIP 108903 / NRRL B-16338 / NBRC 102104 / LLR-40K-21) TaxID=446470 RepID=D3Q721_STANL|nr:alpha/beta hydrolase [Stackebrandtia nassauensis]ADD40420.1 alpha/beta hydrolase fold protein [Stackebrandtia nassauensis DSM 44728]
MNSTRKLVHVNDVDLCVETFGHPDDPPVLLIMGTAAPMDSWPTGFCERLAARDRYVIRYDSRDTGQATSFEPGKPSYRAADLTNDALGLLDALDIPAAELVGVSMGSGIGQELAVSHPHRVTTLTLLGSSPLGSHSYQLPGPSAELGRWLADPGPPPDWSDRAAVVERLLADLRLYHGSVTMDEDAWRELAERIVDRTTDMAACTLNHWVVLNDPSSGDGEPDSSQITVPTLVLHGTEDPLFPYPHAEALAALIPNARLVPMDGVGHQELPEAVWGIAVEAIVDLAATRNA